MVWDSRGGFNLKNRGTGEKKLCVGDNRKSYGSTNSNFRFYPKMYKLPDRDRSIYELRGYFNNKEICLTHKGFLPLKKCLEMDLEERSRLVFG
jgi:hypothetical protein